MAPTKEDVGLCDMHEDAHRNTGIKRQKAP